jgi:hypothetical protein
MIALLMAVVAGPAALHRDRPSGPQLARRRDRPTLLHPPRHVFVGGFLTRIRGGFRSGDLFIHDRSPVPFCALGVAPRLRGSPIANGVCRHDGDQRALVTVVMELLDVLHRKEAD